MELSLYILISFLVLFYGGLLFLMKEKTKRKPVGRITVQSEPLILLPLVSWIAFVKLEDKSFSVFNGSEYSITFIIILVSLILYRAKLVKK